MTAPHDPPAVLVGCCGFAYREWDGAFYPEGIRGTAARLDFYASRFRLLELDFTYYGMPTAKGLARYARGDLAVVVKAHRSMTHERDAGPGGFARFRQALGPLVEAGNLLAVLGQFPQSFRWNRGNAAYLRDFHEGMGGIPWALEARSASWDEPRVREWLARKGIALCLPDQPRLPGLFLPRTYATAGLSYVRFHGRNAGAWHAHAEAAERYTWDYRDAELAEWVERVAELARRAARVAVAFNNHNFGAAPRDAARFAAMLEEKGIRVG